MRRLIERRLKGTRPPEDQVAAALARLPDGVPDSWIRRPLVPAAVLVPLIERGCELSLLLTQRTEHLVDHPGQISFPGGRCEPTDVNALATALRETQEEIGVAAESITVVGYLEPMPVVTGFAVAPVVGFVADDAKYTLDPFEVAEIFEVPLEFFLDDANHQRRERTVRGVTMPFSEYRFDNRRIWGATAMMIRGFTNLLNSN